MAEGGGEYAEFFLDRMRTIQRLLRDDTVLGNHQFKSYDIMGNPRVAESDMPCIRIVPGEDDIRQIETQTRRHRIPIDVYVFDHKPNKGEESYIAQVLLAGRVYDVLMNNRTLADLSLDSGPTAVRTIGVFTEQGRNVNHISRIRTYVESDKDE